MNTKVTRCDVDDCVTTHVGETDGWFRIHGTMYGQYVDAVELCPYHASQIAEGRPQLLVDIVLAAAERRKTGAKDWQRKFEEAERKRISVVVDEMIKQRLEGR